MNKKNVFYLLLIVLFTLPIIGLLSVYAAKNNNSSYNRYYSPKDYNVNNPFYKTTSSYPYDSYKMQQKKVRYSTLTLLLLFLFLLGGVILAVYERSKRKKRSIAAAIKTAYSMQNKFAQKLTEKELRLRDHDFSKTVLQERIWQAFKQIQIAMDNQSFKTVRHFVSDGIYERLNLQCAIRKACKIKNEKRNIDIRNVRIVSIESDTQFDVVHCQITAQAVDYFVNNETQKVVYAQDHPGIFTEYWSFMRRKGVTTLKKASLFEGHCAKCDAKIDPDTPSKCKSCGAIINSGDYDWVLTDIKKSTEWSIKPMYHIQNLDKMQQKDPLFSVQHIEDRASVLFFRYIAACFFAKPDYLTNFATKEFLEQNKTSFTPLPSGEHALFADAVINSIELYSIDLESDEAFDYLNVKVKWSGHRETAMVPSYIKPAFEQSEFFIQEFKFKRSASAKTNTMNLLNSTHCSSCGSFNEIFLCTCQECNTHLNNINQDWLLCSINHLHNPFKYNDLFEVVEYKTKSVNGVNLLPIYDAEILFANTVYIMLDNVNDKNLIELLKYFARINKIQSKKINGIILNAQHHVRTTPLPKDPEPVRTFIRAMLLLCLIDGKMAPTEETVLEKLSAKMGHSTWDIRILINNEKNILFKQAKKIIQSLNKRS